MADMQNKDDIGGISDLEILEYIVLLNPEYKIDDDFNAVYRENISPEE